MISLEKPNLYARFYLAAFNEGVSDRKKASSRIPFSVL